MDIITGFLEATLRMSCPIMLAALGAMFTARAGIINFAMEGIMIMGAFFSVYGSYLTGSPFIGALMGIGGGILAAMTLGYLSITVKVDQVVAGTGINIMYLGLTSYLLNVLYASKPTSVPAFQTVAIPGLSQIPVIGTFFAQNMLNYIAFLLVPLCWYLFNKTSFGLCMRAVGEQPYAADSLGIPVNKLRYVATFISGILGGLGGAALSLGQLSVFMESMTSGRGYLAWSAVTVGKWNPIGIMGASILFGGADAVQLRLQAMGIEVPHQIVQMLPYLITMLVLASVVGRTVSPKAMGKPFTKGGIDMPFAEEELRFPVYYPNPELLEEMRKSNGIAPPQKVRAIMGDLVFPAAPADRPYLYGCMVLSFDGKMGYHDNPEGHLISKANAFDPAGATADFWGWNVCRTYADAVILGCGTLWARIDKPWSAEIVDGDLIVARSELKKRTSQPLSMIATLDGTDVPLKHAILDMRPKPVILTSRKGAEYLARHIGRENRVSDQACDVFADDGIIKILAAGEEKPDTPALLKLLRQSGIGYVSVEAPGYIWNLINERLLDEFLLNYSGVMVGGTHILGAQAPYTVERHPHVALLSVGYHKGFLYTRQKLLYN